MWSGFIPPLLLFIPGPLRNIWLFSKCFYKLEYKVTWRKVSALRNGRAIGGCAGSNPWSSSTPLFFFASFYPCSSSSSHSLRCHLAKDVVGGPVSCQSQPSATDFLWHFLIIPILPTKTFLFPHPAVDVRTSLSASDGPGSRPSVLLHWTHASSQNIKSVSRLLPSDIWPPDSWRTLQVRSVTASELGQSHNNSLTFTVTVQ